MSWDLDFLRFCLKDSLTIEGPLRSLQDLHRFVHTRSDHFKLDATALFHVITWIRKLSPFDTNPAPN